MSLLLISFLLLFLWLICTLAVRFFQTALNADLKIKSVGLFSVQGVSIQFHPQHTLVRLGVYMTFVCELMPLPCEGYMYSQSIFYVVCSLSHSMPNLLFARAAQFNVALYT
uniref:Secreted protein n=1 Tax=Acanthochromis polyacanthus TaxID=80966 RepID=A0A3Q1ECQ1_9TELE